jgi:ubiquinone/menaquinone biosynthesis C-methylase UbiE
MTESEAYPFGYTQAEARRLAEQAGLFEDLTEDVMRRAGLCPGQSVLDIGCGVGDVSLLAARMVGAEGRVLGLDRAASSIETARRRAGGLGSTNVSFEEVDLTSFEPERQFDAIIGRFVLLYVPKPATTLRRLAQFLRPQGIIAFHEIDIPQVAQVPQSELFRRMRGWILEAFSAAGTELEMGSKLYSTFLHAGLPGPEMVSGACVGGGPNSPAYDYYADIVRSLSPVMERNGIASPAEIEIDTLADRLRDAAVTNDSVTFFPRLVGAWTRVAGLADRPPAASA